MTAGPALFARFAYPPNSLGYCGPVDTDLLGELISAGKSAQDELRHAALASPDVELVELSEVLAAP